MSRATKGSSLPAKLLRSVKRDASRPGTASPLSVRVTGLNADDDTRQVISEQLGRKLGKFDAHIGRVNVRFDDESESTNAVCRIKAVLNGLPGIESEERGEQQQDAFLAAASSLERAMGRALGRLGLAERKDKSRSARGARNITELPSGRGTLEGSLIGRRVGRADVNLRRAAERPEKLRRDVPVDTAAPGRSATGRKVGKGATATRNTKLSASRAAYALEDSAQDRPSRKSTRRSSGRVKTDSNLKRRATRATTSPKARATRAKAGGVKRV